MEQEVAERVEVADIIIASAAVSDYRPKEMLFRKMKKTKKDYNLTLVQNPDILAGIGKLKGNRIVVGFAVETDNEEQNAKAKMKSKNLDMIVLNNPGEPGAGFAADTNKVTIFSPGKKAVRLPLLPKTEVASRILEEIVKIVKKQKSK
jgi:phosphopantothenoylcysteine decarboxylase/phosphopantothenate--cysteine ligase